MKNLRHSTRALVCLALAVPAGMVSGAVRVLGAGLTVAAQTDRATTATINNGTAAPGLKDGEASCALVGVSLVLALPIATTGAVGDKVYLVTADNTYSTTAAGAKFIGYLLDTLAAPGVARVGLSNA